RQHADDALPSLLFLLAQRLAEIGEDEQVVRPAVAAERRAPQLEPSARRPERLIDEARRLAGEIVGETQLRGAPAEQLGRLVTEQALAGRVDEDERLLRVEREDGDVDRGHDALQQRGRL